MNLLVSFFYLALNITINTNCCSVEVVLIPQNQPIPIYNESSHVSIKGYIVNDTMDENYFSGIILNMEKNRSYIKGSYALDTVNIEGWIETKYLGIYLVLDDNIPLYSKPDTLYQKALIKNPEWYPLEILKCHKEGWLYVKYQDKNQKKAGWLSPKYQCSNPYTICN